MKDLADCHDRWIIVTADVRIGTNPHEVKAWKQAGHVVFFMKSGWLDFDFWTQVQKFTKYFPQIIEKSERAKPGESFQVGVNGKIV